MLFDLTNAPIVFMNMINRVLRQYMYILVIVFIYGILSLMIIIWFT